MKHNHHPNPCTKIVNGLPCGLGNGHASPCRPNADAATLALQEENARLKNRLIEMVTVSADEVPDTYLDNPTLHAAYLQGRFFAAQQISDLLAEIDPLEYGNLRDNHS